MFKIPIKLIDEDGEPYPVIAILGDGPTRHIKPEDDVEEEEAS